MVLSKLKSKKPKVRYLKEMAKVLYDKELPKKAGNFEVYYVWRGVKKYNELRYDITLIPPGKLGREFVKTKGNRNWKNFPELYQVLAGEAIFLLQKGKGKVVEEVIAIQAEKGDWIVVPPKYAVVMINPSKKILKTGNWVSQKNKNIYWELEKMGGACYFALENPREKKKIQWIKNKNYKIVPKLKFKKSKHIPPENLDFLKGK